MSERPAKNDIAHELRRTLNTLTDDSLNVAVARFSETGLDPDKGSIPLSETLINIGESRDTLLDAIERGKFVQLPLKIQFSLFDLTEAIAREVAELAKGVNAVLNLESAVEDLTAAVWQYQLHNLSGEVLGFKAKMNQLKAQETRIREAARRADDFEKLRQDSAALAEDIVAHAAAAEEAHKSSHVAAEGLQVALRDAHDLVQAVSARTKQADSDATTVADRLAATRQAASDAEATAAKTRDLHAEVVSARDDLTKLTTNLSALLADTEETATKRLSEFAKAFEALREAAEARVQELSAKVDSAVETLTGHTDARLTEVTASVAERLQKLETETAARLKTSQSSHDANIEQARQEFSAAGAAATKTFSEEAAQFVSAGRSDLSRLTEELAELEGRIRTAIERATGFTLFHAFQTRQQQIAKSKQLWAVALAVCVVVSVLASGYFIYHYRDLQAVNPAFFLKLSISIPLIYAITFCNLQYSRERKLEEEYAFKSSVSISLEPYQKLVGSLVDQGNKEELAKYTEFIIQSVGRVFTSPTDAAFEAKADKGTDKTIKAAGDAIVSAVDTVAKAMKR